MKAEIIAIGTEIVLGQLINTNSSYIADELTKIGIDCYFQTNVDDNIDRICEAITHALSRSDIIICCGGLGPTQDDLTKEALAKALNVDLIFDQDLAQHIALKFSSRHRTMSENNLRQAYYPEGAQTLSAFPGTAPGLECPIGDKIIFAVPGVPREMKTMMAHSILPKLKALLHSQTGQFFSISTQTFKAWGLAESDIAQRLDVLDQHLKTLENPTLSFLASGINGIKIRLTTKSDQIEDLSSRNAPFIKIIQDQIGEHLYAYSEDETLEQILINQLTKLNLSISASENFTAGLISSRFANTNIENLDIKTPDINKITTYKGALIESSPLHLAIDSNTLIEKSTASAQHVMSYFKTDIGISAHAVIRKNEHLISYEVALCIADHKNISTQTLFLTQDLAQAREFCVIHLLMLLKKHLQN